VNARLFEELRPVGFAVAYRMLGSVSEAEDIVQEVFLRLHHTLADGERIESPRAYLSTVVARLCIDHLRSARTRRETYAEARPEPLIGEPGAAMPLVAASGPAAVTGAGGDPASHAEMADSLSLAFLVLLESLSPEQRAAFLLREVFDYPYDQIAAIVATSEENARQLVVRARRVGVGPVLAHNPLQAGPPGHTAAPARDEPKPIDSQTFRVGYGTTQPVLRGLSPFTWTDSGASGNPSKRNSPSSSVSATSAPSGQDAVTTAGWRGMTCPVSSTSPFFATNASSTLLPPSPNRTWRTSLTIPVAAGPWGRGVTES